MSKALTQDGEYVCTAPCAECPFRKTGSQVVQVSDWAAERIARDLREGKPFPCHLTSTPEGLDGPTADPADWRMCAGAVLALSEEERATHYTLRLATKAGLHDSDLQPHGQDQCFGSLDEFLKHYQQLSDNPLGRYFRMRHENPTPLCHVCEQETFNEPSPDGYHYCLDCNPY